MTREASDPSGGERGSPEGHGRGGRRRRFLIWSAAAAILTPAAVFVHELGHWAVAHSFGFPDIVLRYGSVSHSAAEAGYPEWQQGVFAGAGPLVTLLIMMVCCAVVVRIGPHPVAVAAGIGAGIRSVIIGLIYIPVRILNPGGVEHGNFDELNAARGLGLPVDLVVGVNVLILLGIWWYLISRIPRSERLATVSAMAVGMVAGLAAYIGLLGPAILP